MRKILYSTLGSALVLALGAATTPAVADVDVLGTFNKTKTVTITETIDKFKTLTITVTGLFELPGAAEALAVANITTTGHRVGPESEAPQGPGPVTLPGPGGALFDFLITKQAEIVNSINDNTGIVGVNQDTGNMTNQGNLVSLSAVGEPAEDPAEPTPPVATHAQAALDQVTADNSVFDQEEFDIGDQLADKTATIADSISGNLGIVGVNQSTGNMNNQTNAVAMAVGFGSVYALSDTMLGQENSNNNIDEIETLKFGVISNSMNGNQGVINVNQSNGNMNNQANAVSMSVLTSNAVVTVPGS